ncbi:MAG: 8-amino-7-oxononanoate synthase, partial [Pedobacter sp.]
MKVEYSFKIYSKVADLPKEWNSISKENIFLTTGYLDVLEQSVPSNMSCSFIGIYEEAELVGVALSQFLDLNKIDPYGRRDTWFKTLVRNLILKTLSSHILIIGNNMLTGQNAFALMDKTEKSIALKTLRMASEELLISFKKAGLKIHIITFKDFTAGDAQSFDQAGFQRFFRYSTQPNMLFNIRNDWDSVQDYVGALSKKYRDQYKRARKKFTGIIQKFMTLEDIIEYEEDLYRLYYHVAKNSHFNTFFLSKDHFRTFK